jgi:hypothetical protein
MPAFGEVICGPMKAGVVTNPHGPSVAVDHGNYVEWFYTRLKSSKLGNPKLLQSILILFKL